MEDDLIDYVRFDKEDDFLIDAPDKESRFSTWTKTETLKLLEAYDQYKESFTHVKQRKHAWDLISTHLQALDIMKSTKGCSIKWSNLTRTYKTAKDNKNKTGRGPIKFEFYEQINAIIGHKDSNAQEGVGVNVGASTSNEIVLTTGEDLNSLESETAHKPKRRRLTAKDKYYKAKLERLHQKDKQAELMLEIKKKKN